LQLESVQVWLPPLGSLQSVYSVLIPEQQAFGVVVSVDGPTHVQTPLVHIPETQPSLPGHAAPFASSAWHAPASQKPDWQSPSPPQGSPFGLVPHVPSAQTPEEHASAPAQGAPSACFAAHVPASQKLDWQSPSWVQALPFGWVPHVPSMHAPVRHAAALAHGWPSGSPHLPW
jgi:hypothetical protein